MDIFESISFTFFSFGYLGSTVYVLLMSGLLVTRIDILGAVGIYMGFVFPLVLIASIGSNIVGTIFGIVSLRVGPLILSGITYLIWQGNLHYLQYPLDLVSFLVMGEKPKEPFSTFILINTLVLLLGILLLLKLSKRN